MYSFSSKDPNFRSRCLDDQEKVFAVLDKVEKLCAGDRQELTDNRESRRCLRIAYDSMKNMTLQPVQTSTMKQPSALDPGQDITTDPETVKEIYPIFEAQNAEEKLMLREREIGANLGSQRVQMLKNLEDTLIGGIIVNCILSSLLAVTVMRNLSKRLKHVLENTGRLVRREVLDLPIKGGDEIAYLDKVLFQTGNHLLELEKFKQELISIVSHELRTPLMSISTSLQLFESDLVIGDLSEKGKDRLRIASEEANRLIRLINDLLDIEKMEAGKFVLDCSEVKAIELVQMSIASVAQPAEAKQLALLPVLEDIELKLHGDKDRICQVLINFLSNAIKFSQEKQTIQISVKKIGTNELKFCVIDQGRGIPEETRQRIFGRFVQVEREDSTVRGGTGLGLAISKAIVEQHGGTIGVDSELGAGSTFWFKLPQAGPA
jgi:signal transduction histidine kinase